MMEVALVHFLRNGRNCDGESTSDVVVEQEKRKVSDPDWCARIGSATAVSAQVYGSATAFGDLWVRQLCSLAVRVQLPMDIERFDVPPIE
jgi:hypothetical protein